MRLLTVVMIAALVMQPNIVVAVAPATYTTAMIGKSCSEFIDVGLHLHMSAAKQLLHTDIWTCHSGAASHLYAAAVLQSCHGCAVAPY